MLLVFVALLVLLTQPALGDRAEVKADGSTSDAGKAMRFDESVKGKYAIINSNGMECTGEAVMSTTKD